MAKQRGAAPCGDNMIKTIVLTSGGMDSAVTLYDKVRELGQASVHALSFTYGAKQNAQESKRAATLCQHLGVARTVIDLAFMGELFRSDLLQSGAEIPTGCYTDASMQRTVVPFRNGIMLSIAAGFAESLGAQEIALSNHSGDHRTYPDCRPEFIDAMSQAVATGTYAKIVLSSPLCHRSKIDVARRGHELNVPFKDTYSCYVGGEKHCGCCGTCTQRREAFMGANLPDPTLYLDDAAALKKE